MAVSSTIVHRGSGLVVGFLAWSFFGSLHWSASGFAQSTFEQQLHSLGSPSETQCNYEYNSSTGTSGSLASPFYPSWYPAFVTCRYTLHAIQPHETIRIVFTEFDLHYPNGDPDWPSECGDVATVTISEHNDKHEFSSDIAVYCGSRLPPALMSGPGHSLVLVFNSRETSMTRGFAANFSFLTDYGVAGGIQDKSSKVCQYLFRKKAVGARGSFTSPNYPGIYPRDTVCHYLFYGSKSDRVIIIFPYFDVEGIPTLCSAETSSDYIELSNFNVNLTDRKMTRLCSSGLEQSANLLDDGQIGNLRFDMSSTAVKSVRSDGNFFRVTFHSNDVYSATGFLAIYSFEPFQEPLYSRQQSASESSLLICPRGLQSRLICIAILFAVISRSVVI